MSDLNHRPILLDGKFYWSIAAAFHETRIDRYKLLERAKSGDPTCTWATPEQAPLKRLIAKRLQQINAEIGDIAKALEQL